MHSHSNYSNSTLFPSLFIFKSSIPFPRHTLSTQQLPPTSQTANPQTILLLSRCQLLIILIVSLTLVHSATLAQPSTSPSLCPCKQSTFVNCAAPLPDTPFMCRTYPCSALECLLEGEEEAQQGDSQATGLCHVYTEMYWKTVGASESGNGLVACDVANVVVAKPHWAGGSLVSAEIRLVGDGVSVDQLNGQPENTRLVSNMQTLLEAELPAGSRSDVIVYSVISTLIQEIQTEIRIGPSRERTLHQLQQRQLPQSFNTLVKVFCETYQVCDALVALFNDSLMSKGLQLCDRAIDDATHGTGNYKNGTANVLTPTSSPTPNPTSPLPTPSSSPSSSSPSPFPLPSPTPSFPINVIIRGQDGYDEAIQTAYDLPPWLQYKPASVVYPHSIEALSFVVSQFAQLAEQTWRTMMLSPIGGTHGSAGYAFSGETAAISLANFSSIGPIDVHSLSLTLQAGVTLGQMVHFLNGSGYFAASGACSTVGISGWHLGGGYSIFAKFFGLGADNVREMQVLLANASLVTANAQLYPDLFWALRGAGHQSFGYVTSYTIGLMPLDSFVFQEMTIECQENPRFCAQALYFWQQMYYHNQTWIDSDLSLFTWSMNRKAPSIDSPISLTFAHGFASDDPNAIQEMQALLAPLENFLRASSSFNTTGYGIYGFDKLLEFDTIVEQTVISPLYEAKIGVYLKRDLDVEDYVRIMNKILSVTQLQRNNPGIQPGIHFSFEAYTGQVTNKASDYNAHFQRSQTLGDLFFDLFIYTESSPSITLQTPTQAWDAAMEWLQDIYATSGNLESVLYHYEGQFQAYVNYRQSRYGQGNFQQRWPALINYYGGNLCRLVEVKRKYDPHMVFDFPQGIPVEVPEGACPELPSWNPRS